MKEGDPVRQAKLMYRLGEAEFQEIDTDTAAERLPEAVATLKEYRDEVQTCEKGLDSRGVNPETHPAGYKQLQISLRESLRHLDDLLVNFTADRQAPFLEVRKDLEQLDVHLIHELFPTQPVGDISPPKPKS